MYDNLYVEEFRMKQKQERLEKQLRQSWMWAFTVDQSEKHVQVSSTINCQPTCCPAT